MARAAKRRNRRARRNRTKTPVQEMIGRYVMGDAQTSLYRSRAAVKTVDETVPDYEFYDRLRRGKAVGYSLGGLFCKRIERIFAGWTLGRGVTVELSDADPDDEAATYTNGLLAEFVAANHTLLMAVERDKLGLGDQYIIVNADGTLSVPSPDTVRVERDPLDYRTVTACTVETKMSGVTIRDRYTATERTVTVIEGGRVTQEASYPNLVDRIPVVHLAHGLSGNETNGHPIHETLLPLFNEYDDLAYKQLDGAKLLGNPILTLAGMEDINAVMDANQPTDTETYEDRDGATQTRQQLNIDRNTVLLIGKGGSASFTAPPVGFTGDTAQALKTLFWLLLDHTGIPEFIWGNQVSSGRSSSETQMDQFVRDIEALRVEDEKWLLDLCGLWLEMTALADRQVVVDKLAATWPPLLGEDQEIRLKTVEFARNAALLTDKTALALLSLVDDPQREVEEAEAEADARREALFPNGDSADFARQLGEAAAFDGDDQDDQDEDDA